MSRIGLGAAGGTAVKAGESVLGNAASQAVKGAAADAGTAVATDAAHQMLTPGNAGLDTNSLLNAGALGAVQGAGVRGVGGVSDAVNARQFSDIDPAVGQRLAARLGQQDTSTPSASYDALANVRRDLGTEVSRFSKDAGPQLRDLAASNPSDDTGLMLDKARADIKAGQPIDPDTLDTLSNRIGGYSEGANLVAALAEHSALNQVAAKGNENDATETFQGGLSGNPLVQQFIKPFGKTSLSEAAAASAVPALMGHGFSPELSVATLGGQSALYTAMRGVDQLLGVHNPLGEFATRFAPDTTPPSIMASNAGLPSFRQMQAQAGGPGGSGNGGPSGPQTPVPAPNGGGGGPAGTQPPGSPGTTPGPLRTPQAPTSPQPLPVPPALPVMPPASPEGPAIGIAQTPAATPASSTPVRPVIVAGRVVLAKPEAIPSPESSPNPMAPMNGGAAPTPTTGDSNIHPAIQAALARQQAAASPSASAPASDPTSALLGPLSPGSKPRRKAQPAEPRHSREAWNRPRLTGTSIITTLPDSASS